MKTVIPERIRLLASSGRIPNSLLIEGRDREMCFSSARHIAAAMVCTGIIKPCGECRDCQKAFSASHPDITLVTPEEKHKYIGVSEIRALRRDAFIKPNEAEARVFIIRDAENMNEEAQNALLKVLEEPPESVGIILTAVSRSRLLPTVRSRLMLINIDSESRKADAPVSDLAVAVLLDSASVNGYGILRSLNKILSDRTDAIAVFDSIKELSMRALSQKHGKSDPQAPQAVEEAASRLTTAQLIAICDWCESGKTKMNANANKRLASVSLSADINRILGI